MNKFLVETECADLTDHHLFWCSKCNANKIDSLEHASGRFFCISGHEFNGSVGDCKRVLFAICTNCLATDMWASPPQIVPQVSQVSLQQTFQQVQESPLFKSAFKKRDLKSCITMAAALMGSSLEAAEDCVVMLLQDQN